MPDAPSGTPETHRHPCHLVGTVRTHDWREHGCICQPPAADHERGVREDAETEVLRLRDKVRELNRRAQAAESAVGITIEDCRRQGVSLGRALANAGYAKLAAENADLRAQLAARDEGGEREGGDAGKAAALYAKLYHELLYEVANKYEGETRHETARRFIRERQTPDNPARASRASRVSAQGGA